MSTALAAGLLVGVVALALVFSTVTYALRDLSRVRLAAELEKRRAGDRYATLIERADDLAFLSAGVRLAFVLLSLVLSIELVRSTHGGVDGDDPTIRAADYALGFLIAGVALFAFAIALPHALANNAGENIVARFSGPLLALRWLLSPLLALVRASDYLVSKLAGPKDAIIEQEKAEEQLEEDILDAVDEGQREGLVDPRARELIENVIEFRSLAVSEAMTPRGEIVAVPHDVSLAELRRVIEQTGHSRLPVYRETSDRIVGVLYARDLLNLWDVEESEINLKALMRSPIYVPASKPLAELLYEFREKKIHLAIVLDEFGGTAGLVTIEDVLEEIVGDISDEHEPQSDVRLTVGDDGWSEADARMFVGDFNKASGLALPEDEDYGTVAGFVTHTLGKIPKAGARFEAHGAEWEVTDAEPQRVTRVRVRKAEAPAAEPVAGAA